MYSFREAGGHGYHVYPVSQAAGMPSESGGWLDPDTMNTPTNRSRRAILKELGSSRRWLQLAGQFLGGFVALSRGLRSSAPVSIEDAARALGGTPPKHHTARVRNDAAVPETTDAATRQKEVDHGIG